MSLSDNDDHILRAIAGGKVEQLFISVYGDMDTDANRELCERALALTERRQGIGGRNPKPLNVQFFDAESANVWTASTPKEKA